MFVYSRDQNLLIFSSCRKKDCIVQMGQRQIMLFIAVPGSYAFLLDESETIVVLQEKLPNSVGSTANRDDRASDEGRQIVSACNVRRFTVGLGNIVFEL